MLIPGVRRGPHIYHGYPSSQLQMMWFSSQDLYTVFQNTKALLMINRMNLKGTTGSEQLQMEQKDTHPKRKLQEEF